MKKKLLVITVNSAARIGLLTYLASIFGNYLDIDARRIANVDQELLEDVSYVLYSSQEVKELFTLPLPEHVHEMVCIRTFNHTYLHKMLQIPPGAFVYLVNDTERSAYQVINQLQEFGITQYHLIPCYPGCGPGSPDIKYAVTVGELRLVPPHIPIVIDIGNRVPDISTVNEIIAYFNLPMSLANEVTRNYINHIVQILKLSNAQLSHNLDTQHITQVIINNIVNGVCLIDGNSEICMVNTAFQKTLGLVAKNPVGSSLERLLGEIGIFCDLQKNAEYQVQNKAGQVIRLWIQEIDTTNSSRMYLIHSYLTESPEAGQDSADHAVWPAGRQGLCGFGEIISQNPKTLAMLEDAKRVSLSDFHVVIQGESGTEKEMLAQAIHNNSKRHSAPFITLSLISPESSALEARLFGFAGADGGEIDKEKAGKGQVGILEAVDGGTLFINGLQNMPRHTQALLLEVIQSGAFKRIGGKQTIHVNFRIIASADRDLYPMVLDGSFLGDLFFAISSVSLETLPLRRRREDVPLLLDHFLKNTFNNPHITMGDVMTDSLCQFLRQYTWPGNAQEACNLCKYFSCVGKDRRAGLEDLPRYILNQIADSQGKLSKTEKLLLQLIKKHPKIGRSSLHTLLSEQGMDLSEGKIRAVLQKLAEGGYLTVHKTRGGCEITEKGDLMIL